MHPSTSLTPHHQTQTSQPGCTHGTMIPSTDHKTSSEWPRHALPFCQPCNPENTHRHCAHSLNALRDCRTEISLEQAFSAARNATQNRIHAIKHTLLQGRPEARSEPLRKTLCRLTARLNDLNHAETIIKEQQLQFKSFSGWSKLNGQFQTSRAGHSEFEAVVAVTKDGQNLKIPLDSRIGRDNGKEIDLNLEQVKHDDHAHDHWSAYSLKNLLQAHTRWKIAEDEEGCPCCIAGLDFDEFAAAIKEISRTNGANEALVGGADFGDPAHWGIFLGIAAPLGLIGLAAAIRNIEGTGNAFAHLDKIIQNLSKDIERLKQSGNTEDVQKLEAFKACLVYSKRDARFNWWVPGVINGTASSLVLSTAALKHPFALPAIALYATGQLGRNLYDAARVRNHPVKPKLNDIAPIIAGKEKVNQIAKSKLSFYLANAFGFATFATGALLTFLAVPAMGLFGAGAIAMPVGLTLLSFGAASTGIMNNIWPRKFKPRNGDLGINRMALSSQDHALQEIAWRRERKKVLQSGFSIYKNEGNLTKKWLKFLTALPESKDFLPQKWASKVSRIRKQWLPLLPDTGSAASQNKHQLNLDIAQRLHEHASKSRNLQLTRLSLLEKMANKPLTQNAAQLTEAALFRKTWALLGELNLHKEIVPVWLNEQFTNRVAAPKGTVGKHQHEHDHTPDHDHHCQPCHGHEHTLTHEHKHEERGGHQPTHRTQDAHKHNPHEHHCGGNHNHHTSTPGLRRKSDNWSVFDVEKFLEETKDKPDARKRLQAAVDYFLFFQYPKTLTYQVYGLNDFYQQMRRIEAKAVHHDVSNPNNGSL